MDCRESNNEPQCASDNGRTSKRSKRTVINYRPVLSARLDEFKSDKLTRKRMMKKFCLFASLLLLVQASSVLAETTKADVEFLGSAGSELPFSEAVRVGRTLYLSGQVGIDSSTGKLAPGGIKGETAQTLENIKIVLEKHGARMSDVVKCTVMLADIAEWGTFNEIYVTYFKPPMPARSAFGASGLALNSRVEVECIAVLPD
jgi:reactive intermediate/imine deaminase